jgi:hypothetical protein
MHGHVTVKRCIHPNEFVAFEHVFVRVVVMIYALHFVQHFCEQMHVFIALFHNLRFFGQQQLQNPALVGGQCCRT